MEPTSNSKRARPASRWLVCAVLALAAPKPAAAQRGAPDADFDGLSDAEEQKLGSKPNDADTDDDGVVDGDEGEPGSDTDRDGLLNVLDDDSDGDGIGDGTERGTDCTDPDTRRAARACRADTDGGETTTEMLSTDTDGDGYADGVEDANRNGVVDDGERDPNNGPLSPGGGTEFAKNQLEIRGGGFACSAGRGDLSARSGLVLAICALGLASRRRRRGV